MRASALRRTLLHAKVGLLLAGALGADTVAPADEPGPTPAEQIVAMRAWAAAHPDDVEARVELGRLLLAEGQADAAVFELERALDRDVRHVQAHLLLALALQQRPRPDPVRALALLQRAVSLAPGEAEARLHLAQLYQEMGRHSEAKEQFTEALERSDDQATQVSARLGLSVIYEQRGQPEQARQEYEQARALYPEIEQVVSQAELARLMPRPVYGGRELQSEDPSRPSLSMRIRQAEAALKQLEER